jgi:hypothetical protein
VATTLSVDTSTVWILLPAVSCVSDAEPIAEYEPPEVADQ